MTENPPSPQTPLSFALREHVVPSDRGKLFDLLNSGNFFYPHEMAYGMGLFDEHLLKGENSSYQFMLYEEARQMVACGCYGALPLTDRRYHLHWLIVAPNHHNKGVGRRLEAAMIARIRLQGGVKVYAETSNRPYHARARKFYELCGYKPGAVIIDYYAAGQDKMLYVKDV
jgi:ribosomal protein S18 acetylase RimI-like enzyme